MTYPEQTQLDDIQPGYGVVRVVVGGPIALSASITYTCDFEFGGQQFTNVAGVIPMWGRFPDPILVRAHPVNTPFPAFAIRGDTGFVVQAFMPPEIPDFGPCAPQSPAYAPIGAKP